MRIVMFYHSLLSDWNHGNAHFLRGVATELVCRGHTVDMGYMQVNSANLKWLGYTVEDMFDPCKNLAAGAYIFEAAYLRELPKHRNKQAALMAGLSVYNTGNSRNGFYNGYVAKYYR